jgi:hypothetical protein
MKGILVHWHRPFDRTFPVFRQSFLPKGSPAHKDECVHFTGYFVD